MKKKAGYLSLALYENNIDKVQTKQTTFPNQMISTANLCER